LISSVLLVFMFFGGGAHPLAVTFTFIFFHALFSFLLKAKKGKKDIYKMIMILGIISIFTFCLGAIKLIPTLELLHNNPRQLDEYYSGYSLQSLKFSLLNRGQTIEDVKTVSREKSFLRGFSWNLDENSMYVGIVPLVFFLIGFLIYFKKRMVLAFCFIFLLWLSFGNRMPISLWELFYNFPIFNSMRVAQRFRFVFMLCFAIFAGFGLEYFKSNLSDIFSKKYIIKIISYGIVIFVLMDLVFVSFPIFNEMFNIPPIKTLENKEFFQIEDSPPYDKNGFITHTNPDPTFSSWSSLYPFFLSNIGIVNGYEPLILPSNAVPKQSKNYNGEFYLDGNSGKISIREWTLNKFIFDIDVKRQDYLIFNQNYYPGWKAKVNDEKRKVESRYGLMAVRMEPSDKIIELYYLPTSFLVGLLINVFSMFFGLFLWKRYGKEKRLSLENI